MMPMKKMVIVEIYEIIVTQNYHFRSKTEFGYQLVLLFLFYVWEMRPTELNILSQNHAID